MLDNLSGIGEDRTVEPDRMSDGLRKVLEVEHQLTALYKKYLLNPSLIILTGRMLEDCEALMGGCRSFTKSDLETYILMRFDKEPSRLYQIYGMLTGKLISGVYLNTGEEYICADFEGKSFPWLFFYVQNFSTLIIENAKGHFIGQMMGYKGDVRNIIVTNSSGNCMLDGAAHEGHIDTVVLANCDSDAILDMSFVPSDITNIVVANCRYERLNNGPKGNYNNLLIVNSSRYDMMFDSTERKRCSGIKIEVTKNKDLSLFTKAAGEKLFLGGLDSRQNLDAYCNPPQEEFRQACIKLYELGLSMKGKDGLQIYDLSKQITHVLGELKVRC